MAVTPAPPAVANHEPIYKTGLDTLNPGSWEAHFVWLRSEYFNFLGEVWWRVLVLEGKGTVNAMFLNWAGFRAFHEGEPFEPLLEPQYVSGTGYGWKSQLTSDLPYFLVIENPGRSRVQVMWAIFAELDFRRWQGQEPGPTLELDPAGRSPLLTRDAGWEKRFHEPGLYVAHTEPFVDNTGLIEVVPSAAPGPAVDVTIQELGFHPEVLRIPAGTTVRWTNQDDHESTITVGLVAEALAPASPPRPGLAWALLPAATAGAAAVSLVRLFGRRPRREGSPRPRQAARIKHK